MTELLLFFGVLRVSSKSLRETDEDFDFEPKDSAKEEDLRSGMFSFPGALAVLRAWELVFGAAPDFGALPGGGRVAGCFVERERGLAAVVDEGLLTCERCFVLPLDGGDLIALDDFAGLFEPTGSMGS